MKEIVSLAGELYPSSKVIISTPTPRADNKSFNMKGQLISVLLKQEYFDNEKVYLCDHSNLLNKGRAIHRFLSEDDKYHLSDQGVNVFAANIRDIVDEALNLPIRRPFYSSNVNLNNGSRGGYRERGGYCSRGGYRGHGHNNYNNYQNRGRGYG
ncbi:unnamed protein product [Mytilus coruscus]|uniref:SGNH hydrolase-type esterase domain-containing protein n=1 Tax=Mytilus coruscus TaxID=42192 RepID=A0A6J8BFD1_MYTCO|nr:unnamed protein product [Mytilus coruscus]